LYGTLDGIVQQTGTNPWKSKSKERGNPMAERRGSQPAEWKQRRINSYSTQV